MFHMPMHGYKVLSQNNLAFTNLNDGMKIPSLGFGTWKIENSIASEIIKSALHVGYRLIDTASVYENEQGVGLGIKESGIPREEIFLTTKVWNTDQGYDSTLRAMDNSLSKLKTNYVDLYLIHWPRVNSETYIPTWKALARLRTEGLARSIGVSNFNESQIERLMNETGIKPAVNQVELHPNFQQKDLVSFHQSHNILTQAWSPLARGQFLENSLINNLARKYNKTPTQILLRWHFESGFVAIPKTTQIKRMIENFDILNFSLEESDLNFLRTLDSTNGRTGPNPLTANF